MLPNHKKKTSGFTLVELLIVIAIIGILISVGLASFRRAQTQARDGQRKADIENIRGALEQFYSDNNIYPTAATWETELEGSTGKVYLKKVPKQPDGTTSYPYTGTSQTYCVSVNLEINPPAGTPTCDGNNYGLTAQD